MLFETPVLELVGWYVSLEELEDFGEGDRWAVIRSRLDLVDFRDHLICLSIVRVLLLFPSLLLLLFFIPLTRLLRLGEVYNGDFLDIEFFFVSLRVDRGQGYCFTDLFLQEDEAVHRARELLGFGVWEAGDNSHLLSELLSGGDSCF